MFRGKILLFWGSNGGPQGPIWPIRGPLSWVRWVERRKGAFGSFERVFTSWKVAKENRLVSGVNIVVWGLQWGSPGSQIADTWPLATGEVD